MDPYSFQDNTFEEDNQIIRDSLKTIGQRYQVTKVTEAEEGQIQQQLAQFDAFQAYQQVILYGAAKVTHNNHSSYFTVVTLNAQPEGLTVYQSQQPDLTEFTFAGLTRLKKNYGDVKIRPDTTTDKLVELFKPTKIKFPMDKAFHKHYHVTADDTQHLKEKVTTQFLDTIKQHEALEIEIKGRDLLVRLPKGISVKVAEQLADFLAGITVAG